jgi:hypothetical protein
MVGGFTGASESAGPVDLDADFASPTRARHRDSAGGAIALICARRQSRKSRSGIRATDSALVWARGPGGHRLPADGEYFVLTGP